jgi:hypothetical protein
MSLFRLLAAASLLAAADEESRKPHTFASTAEVARMAQAIFVPVSRDDIDDFIAPAPTPAADTRALQAALEGQTWDAGRVALLKSAMPYLRITAAQAAEILETFTFDSGRLKAAFFLAPRVVNPQDWFQVGSTFSFGGNGRKAVALLR